MQMRDVNKDSRLINVVSASRLLRAYYTLINHASARARRARIRVRFSRGTGGTIVARSSRGFEREKPGTKGISKRAPVVDHRPP